MIGEKRTMCQFLLICFSFLLVSSFVEEISYIFDMWVKKSKAISVGGNCELFEIEESWKNYASLKERAENITNEVEKIVEIRSNIDGRIVNGSEAFLGQFPQQVSLRRSWSGSHFCGGNIIDLKWILTAAHCMFQNRVEIKPWTITVVAGNVLLQGESITQQERGVKKIIVHQNYNDETLENDIALLKLQEPLLQTEVVQVAKIPEKLTKPFSLCQVAGWGYLSNDVEVVSNELMFVELPLLPQKKCRELLHEVSFVPDGMLCAGYEEGGKDACRGDSGGGFLCNGQLTGVVSGGKGCGDPGFPGLYSDVHFYKKWIKFSILKTKLDDFFFSSFSRSSGSSNFLNIFWLVSLLLSTFLRIM